MIDQKCFLMFLTETWCKLNTTAVLNELIPPGYSFIGECRSSKRGGGVGVLYKSAYKFRKTTTKPYDTFEHLDVKSAQKSRPVRIVIIYRPPTISIMSFLDEFATFVNEIVVTRQDILIVGDFNFHCKHNGAPGVKVLNDILAENNLKQQVTDPTHMKRHMLELVIIRSSSSFVSLATAYPSSISDHYGVVFRLSSASPVYARPLKRLRDFCGNYQEHHQIVPSKDMQPGLLPH